MSINPNRKALTTISKAAVKTLGDKPMVWYAVQIGSDYIFGIDKKVKDPGKFKKALVIQKYLDKLKIDTNGIDSKSPSASGLLQKNGDKIEISVVCKANGGGKSTLKAVLKDGSVKKMVPNAEIVKSIGAQTEEQKKEDAIDAAAEKELTESKIEISKELKTAIKYFLWWKQGAKDTYTKGISAPSLKNEDDLQKIYGRLKKFIEGKMYKLFETKKSIFGDKKGPLAQFKETDFDLTKNHLKEYIANLKTALETIENLEDVDALDAEAEDEAAEEIASLADDLDTVAELMELSSKEIPSFKESANKNKAVWKIIWSDFGTNPSAIIDIKNSLANGTWEDFFKIAKQFEGK